MSTSSTENERDGLGMNMRLEKFVCLPRRPIWLAELAVTAIYHDHGPRSLHQNNDVHPEAQRDIGSRVLICSISQRIEFLMRQRTALTPFSSATGGFTLLEVGPL